MELGDQGLDVESSKNLGLYVRHPSHWRETLKTQRYNLERYHLDVNYLRECEKLKI